jgi:hypothetical protein
LPAALADSLGSRFSKYQEGGKIVTDRPGQPGDSEDRRDDRTSLPAARHGRRTLMRGTAAAGAGVVASLALGGLAEAQPDGSGPVSLGKANLADATTSVNAKSGTGLEGRTRSSGQSGVSGFDDTTEPGAYGVYGRSKRGHGVLGISEQGSGIVGQASVSGQSGVAGIDLTPGPGGHGTYGQSNYGFGVFGFSYHGTGVVGQGHGTGQSGVAGIDISSASDCRGVFGQSHHGTAVYATTTDGTAVLASSSGGIALDVRGPAKFSNSGITTVPAGDSSITVTAAGVTASSIVLATIQAPQSGIHIEGATPAAGSFTITLSGKAASDLAIGWLAIA